LLLTILVRHLSPAMMIYLAGGKKGALTIVVERAEPRSRQHGGVREIATIPRRHGLLSFNQQEGRMTPGDYDSHDTWRRLNEPPPFPDRIVEAADRIISLSLRLLRQAWVEQDSRFDAGDHHA
jgi:hypothetical protein